MWGKYSPTQNCQQVILTVARIKAATFVNVRTATLVTASNISYCFFTFSHIESSRPYPEGNRGTVQIVQPSKSCPSEGCRWRQ